MTQHTIFGSGGPAAVQNSDTAGLNLATAFYVTSGTTWTATGIRFWLDAASNAPLTGYQGWLSSGSNAQSMSALASVAFTGSAVKGGWNTATFNSPVALAVGTKYWVVVYFPGGCYSATAHAFDTARQASDGSALYGAGNSEVSPGNGAYDYGPASQMSAAGSYNATWYGVDVVTDDGLAPPPSGAHRSAWAAGTLARRWGATPPERRWATTGATRRWNGGPLA